MFLQRASISGLNIVFPGEPRCPTELASCPRRRSWRPPDDESRTFENFFLPIFKEDSFPPRPLSSSVSSLTSSSNTICPPPLPLPHTLPIFLYVYLSTFTVTALESQEYKLASSPPSPSPRLHWQQIHAPRPPSPLSIFLRHIG